MTKTRHPKGAPGGVGGRFAPSQQPQPVQGGTPLSLEQVDNLRDLVNDAKRTGRQITDTEVTRVLADDDDLPTRDSEYIRSLIDQNSIYGGSEYSKMLLFDPEQALMEGMADEDRILVDGWIEWNQPQGAKRFEKARHMSHNSPKDLLAWGYDDIYFGSLIRAMASLQTDPIMTSRPSKEKVLSLCYSNEDLENDCLDALYGNPPDFNALTYSRICEEAINTETIYSLEAEIAGENKELPKDYVRFN